MFMHWEIQLFLHKRCKYNVITKIDQKSDSEQQQRPL